MKKVILFIYTSLLFISCEKELILEQEDIDRKLVVNCIFSPDTNFRVFVGYTQPMNEVDSIYAQDALVILFENNAVIDTMSYELGGWYSSPYLPQVNESYQIQVLDGNNIAFASSYVPDSIQNFTGTYELIYNQSGGGNNPSYEIEYIYKFSDPPESNFYHIMEGIYFQTPENYQHLSDPSVLADSELKFEPGSLFFSDDLFNGDTVNITINLIHLGGLGGQPAPFSGSVKSTSEEYYLFMKSWVKHKFNQNTSSNLEDPITVQFQGAPTELYSNVSGGYGIFAGFYKTQTDFDYIP